MELYKWDTIKNRFKLGTLLLGNGSSIAVDNRLSYKSLYDQVCNSGKLSNEVLGIFKYFNTTNFEFIMKLLLEASQINTVLNINEIKPINYYYELRNALINTVREIHPTYKQVERLLPNISDFLSDFKTVFTLNYDLLVYWAMLVGNEKFKCQWFKDAFVNGFFEYKYNFLYDRYGSAGGSTLVFYPHGSLFLATDTFNNETKLIRSESKERLLETVLSKWREKDIIPLFVSEGTTDKKFQAITRSGYLNSVYNSMLNDTGPIVIYGWSAGEQDEHIFNSIDHEGVKAIAKSVHVLNTNWETDCEIFKNRISRTRHLADVDVYFFDSASDGCWIYPIPDSPSIRGLY